MDATADNRKFPPHPSAGIEAIGSDATPLRRSLMANVSKGLPVPRITAFANGFLGGLAGGIAYQFAPSWLQFRELPFATVSILALALVLGAFEVWRAAQVRTPRLVGLRLLVVLVACLVVLLTVTAMVPAPDVPSQDESTPVPTTPRTILVC